MIQRDYLIIGAGIGGASVCEAIRKYDKRGSVTLVGAETFLPTSAGCFRKVPARKDRVPRKDADVDERWYQAHKIETRFDRGDAIQYRSPAGSAGKRRDDRI